MPCSSIIYFHSVRYAGPVATIYQIRDDMWVCLNSDNLPALTGMVCGQHGIIAKVGSGVYDHVPLTDKTDEQMGKSMPLRITAAAGTMIGESICRPP